MARAMLANEKIDAKTLYKMNIAPLQKLKFTTLAIFGTSIHSRIQALFSRKLC